MSGFVPQLNLQLSIGVNMYRKFIVLIILTLSLVMSFIIVGCGETDDNNQPVIDLLDDKTLEIGETRTVRVYITDVDIDDIHIIRASSDNPNVATVSVDDTSLTIIGNAVGMTTITVSATDGSGQDNDTSLPITFQVTVNEPPPPPINKGLCVVGMTLQPGEGCIYIANEEPVLFYVNEDGSGCRMSEQPIVYNPSEGINIRIQTGKGGLCVYDDIRGDAFYNTIFSADKNSNGSWTISRVPNAPCQIPPLDEDYDGTPALFVRHDSTNVLLSDGDYVAFVGQEKESPYPLVFGGTVQTPTSALVEFAGGDFRNVDGALISDGKLTEFEIGDTFEGVIELKENRSVVRIDVPEQDGITIRGFGILNGFNATGTTSVTCTPFQDNAVAMELIKLAEDMLEIMRKNR